MRHYKFEQIEPTKEDWARIESATDSTCYQSQKWYAYLKRIGVKPFIAAVYSDTQRIGYFLGEKIWLGIPMVTAPIEGIGTYTQGLNMLLLSSEEERLEIYQALATWIFKTHIALTMQVDDWQLRRDSAKWMPCESIHQETIEQFKLPYSVRPTLHISLNKSEDELWKGLSYKSCKYCINKAKKLGLKVQEITEYEDIQAFCKAHYDQLLEVCKGKGERPKPAQSEERMRALCESLWPDRVMMLECVGKDEKGLEQVMSTSIFCINKGQSAYWTGASYKQYHKYCPNELMVWEAMKRLNARGVEDLNFCGMADYKLKFGTIYAYVPRLKFAKYKILLNWTQNLKKIYYRFIKNSKVI